MWLPLLLTSCDHVTAHFLPGEWESYSPEHHPHTKGLGHHLFFQRSTSLGPGGPQPYRESQPSSNRTRLLGPYRFTWLDTLPHSGATTFKTHFLEGPHALVGYAQWRHTWAKTQPLAQQAAHTCGPGSSGQSSYARDCHTLNTQFKWRCHHQPEAMEWDSKCVSSLPPWGQRWTCLLW